MSALAFRNLLEAGDVGACRRAWAQLAPHLPQPKTDREAEILMHHARTGAESVAFAKRAWSHRWLCERNWPSGLPDALRPNAERLYPRVAEAVGISCTATNPMLAPAVAIIRGSMEDAVSECYADGRTEPAFVKERMQAARHRAAKHLFGSIAVPRAGRDA